MKLIVLVSALMLVYSHAGGQSFTGRFVGHTEDGPMILTLKQESGGRVSGSLSQQGVATPISGRVQGGILTATATSEGQRVQFTATLSGNTISVSVAGTSVTLTRSGASASPKRGTSKTAAAKRIAAGGLNVRINGVRLDSALIQKLQRKYHLQFRSGDFWYDRRCGAWGMTGGPVSGLVAAGIEGGGKLRRDASSGDTGVIVNGRELPGVEFQALQQLGPVQQGRFWLDSRGNYGREGGPRLGNLIAAAHSRNVPRQGILSTWDRTGVAVFGY